MSEIVKISLKHSSKIKYISTTTGDPGNTITTNQKLKLFIGRIYQIPVDSNGNLDDHNLFKMYGKI